MTSETEKEINQNHNQMNTWTAIWLFVFDFVKVFVIALAVIIPVRLFLFQPFVVTGESMAPNFGNGDYLIIDEMTYRFIREPQRGEVVVLRAPYNKSEFFIKRIVGLPGERVVIENGQVTVYNTAHPGGFVLDEQYLSQRLTTPGNVNRMLGQEEFFVLGDNRISSSDSRFWGPLPQEDIIGRVYLRVFPLNEFQVFSTPFFNTSVP